MKTSSHPLIFGPTQKPQRLPFTAPEAELDIIHLSSRAGLKVIDPAYFGKGKATGRDLRGEPKVYAYLKGSPLGQDTVIFLSAYAYQGCAPGPWLYDTRKTDPLGYWSEINRQKSDLRLKSLGYRGVITGPGIGDERVIVFLFVPISVTAVPRA